MSTFIENAVSVEEVARVTRTTVAKIEEEAAALSLFVGRDWGGRAALSEWDAYQLASGIARQQQESDRRWLQHREATAKWEADRRGEFLQAHAEAFRLAGGAMAGRASDLAAQKAGDAAVAQWERRNPAPTWQGERTASWWRRAAEVLTGAGQ